MQNNRKINLPAAHKMQCALKRNWKKATQEIFDIRVRGECYSARIKDTQIRPHK
jgi:hypothetical protein